MKIVCIGDSVTYGQNVRADEAWPAVLARLTGHDVRNAGVCGDTTRLGLERFPKDVQLHKPDVVCIQFGHNDANCWDTDNGLPRVSADAYAANVLEMTRRADAIGARWLIWPPYATALGPEYNARLAGYARRVSVVGLTLPAVTILEDGYGVHPDPATHHRLAVRAASCL